MSTTTPRQLDEAMASHRPIDGRPEGEETIAEAYGRQDAFVDLRVARTGQHVVGYKVALTNQKFRVGRGTDDPASGTYLDGDVFTSGAQVPLDRFFRPILEIELVMRPERDLPSGVSLEEIIASSAVTIGLEIPDSRYDDWYKGSYGSLRVPLVIGDNCVAGGLLVGDTWVPAGEVDFAALRAELAFGGDVVLEGTGSEVLPSQPHIVQWLAGNLAERGRGIRRGDLISTGTLAPPVLAQRGEYVVSSTQGLGSARIRLT